MFNRDRKNTAGRQNNMSNIFDSDLFNEIRSIDKRSIGFNTGFTIFDYPAAHKDFTIAHNGERIMSPNGGLFSKIYTGFGESETGKTTLLIQAAGAIAESYKDGSMVFIDAEGNVTPERIMSLCNWDEFTYRKKCLYVPNNPPISINDVLNIIRKICHTKAAKGEKFKIDTPYVDIYTGKKIKTYPPTVVLLDSLPYLVISQSQEEHIDPKKEFKKLDQIASNVDGMREAKDNTMFLKKVKSYLSEYNITLLQINHVAKEVPMGMFDKPKKFHPGMKAGEKLTGGKEQIFSAFGLYRVRQIEMIDDRNRPYGDHIKDGYICTLDHVKNKSNISSNGFRYVFDKRTGYRPELTDFEYIWEKKVGLKGSPASMFLTILPEVKFTRKTLVDKCEENPLLTRALNFMAKYVMGNDTILLGRYGDLDLETMGELPIDIRSSILFSTTSPYPMYRPWYFDNYDHYQICAARGNMFTDLGRGYISPINVPKLNNIIDACSSGYMFPNNWRKDPVDIKIWKKKKSEPSDKINYI